ncbi:hypothetical protein B0O80DRAFT_116194 [Mortierella sp. GBAus27b]|nr:hypothetical protein B0O80DRAFT_116194 [Mortierella sp. GBAus27b]
MATLAPNSQSSRGQHHTHTPSTLDFHGASSAATANAMRTELNLLIAQVKEEDERKRTVHDSFPPPDRV